MIVLVLTAVFLLIASVQCYSTVPQPYGYEIDYYPDMPIDHFSYTDNRTFRMRFLYNDTWFKDNGPIFFYTGNEGDITSFGNNTGFMYDIASDFNAMIVFGEHRYYGETLPFGDQTFTELSNFGYLSSEQALADYAQFLRWFKNVRYPATNESQVIAFGGSYGGLLSAWFRMKYPHIVTGSLASAAPMNMFPGLSDCSVFAAVTTRTWHISGDHCDEVIKNSWPILEKMALTDQGRQDLNDIFGLCPDDAIKKPQDVITLSVFLYSLYLSYAVVDYPYPTSFFTPLPGWPVKEACKFLTNPNATDTEILNGISNVLNLYTNYTGNVACNTISQAASPIETVPWNFQLCTELVTPSCANSSTMFFPTTWNFALFSESCQKTYGVTPRENWAVTEYGGNHVQAASNIIFSNGDLDPCSGDGILSPVEGVDSIHIVYITNASHHYDLRGGNDADTAEILQARKIEYDIINGWLGSPVQTGTTTSAQNTTTNHAVSIKSTAICFVSIFLLVCRVYAL